MDGHTQGVRASNRRTHVVDTPRMTLTWTYRALELGRCRLELVRAAVPVVLEVYDGGGHYPGHGIWRVAGRDVAIRSAGQA
jgi:hypothetical protein